jgi:hypothetical protein
MTSAALRKQTRDRDALLDQLSADISRSATLVRDYMLEDDDILAASQRTELQLLRRERSSGAKGGFPKPAAIRRFVLEGARACTRVDSCCQARARRFVSQEDHLSQASRGVSIYETD